MTRHFPIKDEIVHSMKHYAIENRTVLRMMDEKDCVLRIHYKVEHYNGRSVMKPCRCLDALQDKTGSKRNNLWKYNHPKK